MLYEWLKALHVISVIAWMAGLLYLPRLFVYHVGAKPGSELSETLKIMERRLLRFITTPSMLASYGFGIAMLVENPGLLDMPYIHAKLGLVALLTVFHGLLARWRRAFASDSNRHSAKFYRILNEAPTLLMIGIVILVIIRPF